MGKVIMIPDDDYIKVSYTTSGDVLVPRDLAYEEFYQARRKMYDNAEDWLERLVIHHLIKSIGYDACLQAAAEEIARQKRG